MFNDYLQDIYERDFADGVLDDDLQDRFESWLAELDIDTLCEYAQTFGRKMYLLGQASILNKTNEHKDVESVSNNISN